MVSDESAAADAIARKERSMAQLRSEGVPVIEHLPAIESETDALRRDVETVAYRTMALLVVAVKGEGIEQSVIDDVITEYGLAPHFTPKEKAFLGDTAPPYQDRVQFTWRYEAACALLWALGYLPELGKPTAICDVANAVTTMRQRSAEQFIAEANLRPLPEILDQADLIYRYHWAVRDARINGRPVPAGLEPGVTLERHHALNWLIGYMDDAWDDVSTDT